MLLVSCTHGRGAYIPKVVNDVDVVSIFVPSSMVNRVLLKIDCILGSDFALSNAITQDNV